MMGLDPPPKPSNFRLFHIKAGTHTHTKALPNCHHSLCKVNSCAVRRSKDAPLPTFQDDR